MSDEQIKEVEELAGLMFTPGQIALIVGMDRAVVMEAMECKGGDFYVAFMRGRLMSEAEIRTSVIAWAKRGSSPAQTAALKMIEDSKLKMGLEQ